MSCALATTRLHQNQGAADAVLVYAQLVAMLTLIFRLTVPVTFMSSRRVRCACVQTFLRSFE